MKILFFKKNIFVLIAILFYTGSAFCVDPQSLLSKCDKLNAVGLGASNRVGGMIGCWRAVSPRMEKLLPPNFTDPSTIKNIYSRGTEDAFYSEYGEMLLAYLIFDTNGAPYSCVMNQRMSLDKYTDLKNTATLTKLFNSSTAQPQNIANGSFKLSDDFQTLAIDPGTQAPKNASAYSYVFVRDQSSSTPKDPNDLLITYMTTDPGDGTLFCKSFPPLN